MFYRFTIARFMRAVDPVKINECFMNWMQAAVSSLKGNIIPIDGKTIRSAFDACKEKTGLHFITAWNVQLGLSFGQVQAPEKSNEITAIPLLLDMLNIEGPIVTIDAMGCQKKIAKKSSRKRGIIIWHSREISRKHCPWSRACLIQSICREQH